MRRPIAPLALSLALSTAALAQEARPLAWGDLDADGRLDLWIADPVNGDRLLVCGADGRFEERRDLVAGPPRSRAALWLDVDLDRRQDLLLLGADGGVRLFLGTARGDLAEAGVAAGLDELPAAEALRALDYDDDGRPDLALRTAEATLLLHQEEQASFARALELPRGIDPAVVLPVSSRTPAASAAPRSGEGAGGGAGGGGGPASSGGGPGVDVAPGGSATASGGGHICAGSIEDFADPDACLTAASIPTLGMLYPLGIELFIDSFTGHVGIGTTSPASTLDVAGSLRTDGFRMPTGAGAGKVLISDADGVGTWGLVPDTGNTLDGAYDQGGFGAGRQIAADTGRVEIGATGNDALYLATDGSSDGLEVDVSSDPGGNGIRVLQNGAGDGVRVQYGGTTAGVNVIADSGRAGLFASTGGNNPTSALRATHAGTGIAVDAAVLNLASAAAASSGVTTGTGPGVYGRSGAAPALGAVARAGVAGEGAAQIGVAGWSDDATGVEGRSANTHGVYGRSGAAPTLGVATRAGVAGEGAGQIGVAGWSDTSSGVQGLSQDGDGVEGDSQNLNGVKGTTDKVGTWYGGGITGKALVGSVQGISPDVDTVDNFAVIGDARGYGIGVFGLGGADEGHGVFGVSHTAADGTRTITGVRGVTREDGDPHWELRDDTGKVKVGVLGQAKDFAAVWGESTARVGVAGTAETVASDGDLPAGPIGLYGQVEDRVPDATQPTSGAVIGIGQARPGVLGWSKSANAVGGLSKEDFGVLGHSLAEVETVAGVRAEGNGPGKAAALDVHDGAITVSGATRPAGTVAVTESWTPITSCEGGCTDCPHAHVIGWQATMPVSNGHCKADSIVLLTVEADSVGEGLVAHVAAKTAGGFVAVVTRTGDSTGFCQCPSMEVLVHYMIVNPMP